VLAGRVRRLTVVEDLAPLLPEESNALKQLMTGAQAALVHWHGHDAAVIGKPAAQGRTKQRQTEAGRGFAGGVSSPALIQGGRFARFRVRSGGCVVLQA
jgi:hypothetical protein